MSLDYEDTPLGEGGSLTDLQLSPLSDQLPVDELTDDASSFPPETITALNEMNKDYAAVLLGGKFRIAKEGFDTVAQKHKLSFLSRTDLCDFHANLRVVVSASSDEHVEYKDLAKLWMSWNGRRTYHDVVFDPSCKQNPKVYNLFKGFPLEPQKGNWSLMRRHIHDVICSGNEEYFDYVMAWMARVVQDPGGDRPGVAIVLKGGKGIGKGAFVDYFGSIFGEAFLPIADPESFTGRFNMHLSKALVVFLDEAVWGGDKRAEGKLKQLITEPTILFEPKGIDAIALRNYINVIIASNEEWVVPATGDERRFCVLEVSEVFKQNTGYFGPIEQERKNGGPEAMMFDLLHYDYSDVDLRKAPVTKGLSEQVQHSLPPVHNFWHSVIDRGYVLSERETGRPRTSELVESQSDNDLWPSEICKHEVYAEYIQWCHTQNERKINNTTHFWRSMWRIWAGGKPDRHTKKSPDGKPIEALMLPLLAEAKKAFTCATRIEFDD